MERIAFNESELQVVGTFLTEGRKGEMNVEVPRLNTPITPRENTRLMLKKQLPLWVPNVSTEMVPMKPPEIPDVWARQEGGTDWFGIEWEYEPKSKAAMVKPGTRRLSSLANWEKEIVWPDFDAIDWQGIYDKTYKHTLSEDQFTYFIIFNGLFERLADLTSFADAFMNLVNAKDALNAFFTKLTDWHIEYIRVIAKYFHPDMILFHDDMGAQKAPFFSPKMYTEIMVPHYRRITKAAHDAGMFIMLHSCGNVGRHLPGFIQAGFDGWQGQEDANDKESLMKEYGDQLPQFGMLIIEPDVSTADAVQAIHDRVDGIAAKGRYMLRLADNAPSREVNLDQELYRYSRIKYSGQPG